MVFVAVELQKNNTKMGEVAVNNTQRNNQQRAREREREKTNIKVIYKIQERFLFHQADASLAVSLHFLAV